MSEQHFEDTMEPLELKLLKKEIDAHPFGDTEDEWRLEPLSRQAVLQGHQDCREAPR
jgi:hypothetical protein